MNPASIPRRFSAFCIDYVIFMTISFVLVFLFMRLFGESSDIIWDSTKAFLGATTGFMSGYKMSHMYKFFKVFSFYLTHVKSGMIICSIVTFLYFVYFEQSKWQATIGKKLLGLKVKTIAKKRLHFFRATKRTLFFITPALFFYFLVFSVYPQCLNIINISFHLFKLEIVIPKACIIIFAGYTICYLLWFIPIFFTNHKTTVYDILSNTRVVK